MNVTVSVYQWRDGHQVHITTLGLGPATVVRRGAHEGKARESLIDHLRSAVADLAPRDLEPFQLVRGLRLETVKLEMALRHEGRKRKVSLAIPLVVEPRYASEGGRLTVAYHPLRQDGWFPVHDDTPLVEQAVVYFQQAWAELDDDTLRTLEARKGLVRAVSFTATPKSLLDQLPEKPAGLWDDLRADEGRRGRSEGAGRGYKVLPRVGVNLTAQAAEGGLAGGTPRMPCREQLRLLVCGDPRTSALVVGPSGAGKTTVIERLVLDLLAADDFAAHRNLDRVHKVWSVAGKRIIAGMSHLGEWEQRCLDLLDDARRHRGVLYLTDVHLFGRIGRSRDSDRSLAEFFRGPIARREVLVVGECTPEQVRQLEEDAPGFAALFTRVHVPPTDAGETFRLMVHEVRALEPRHRVAISPHALRTILELGASLFANRVFPGTALDLLRQAARESAGPAAAPGEPPPALRPVGTTEVLSLLSARTGLPEGLLRADEALDPATVHDALSAQVMGQPEAVAAVVDLVMRVRTGLVDPRRPYGVYLFTGPTGTGKTELARALAGYLYGGPERLLRLDMGEYGTPDAAARLIGDRWSPEGTLTRQVREQPFCVVLFDEIEKAHPRVHNLLLQLFDEARLTDAAGSTASFAHAVVVMTSNLGARSQRSPGFGAADTPDAHDHLKAVADFFPPELFNRIDRVVAFRTLSPAVATGVAARELGRLFRRRGLVDRNVFVSASPAVLSRVVREAFRAADGARSLKRYLEDRIGTLLTEHLVAAPRADLQIVRVHESPSAPGGLALHVEALTEAQPVTGRFVLDDLAEIPLDALRARVGETLAWLGALADGPELAGLAEEIGFHLGQHRLGLAEHADPLHTLDSLRGELHGFRGRLEDLVRAVEGDTDHEDLALALVTHDERPSEPWSGTHGQYRLFDRRAVTGATAPPVRMEILAAMAEAYALRRALRRVREPDQHAVFIELVRVDVGEGLAGVTPGTTPQSDLLSQLVAAYARARGAVESWAMEATDGRRLAGPFGASLNTALTQGKTALVLKVVGLCVKDFFELETGTHLWHPLGSAPEVVRVRVLPAPPGHTPSDVLDALRAGRVAADRAVSAGELPPRDHVGMLPVVRAIRFDPPRRNGQLCPLELEDYVMATVRSLPARTLADPLPGLWLVRLSREEA